MNFTRSLLRLRYNSSNPSLLEFVEARKATLSFWEEMMVRVQGRPTRFQKTTQQLTTAERCSVQFATRTQRIAAYMYAANAAATARLICLTLSSCWMSPTVPMFRKTLYNSTHTLHTFLPPQSTASQHYHLRRRTHDRQLPTQISHLCNNNFLRQAL